MDTLAAWVATYLIHSTLLICGASLLGPWLRRRPEVASPVWKVALVGGIVTATVQVGAGVTPFAGIYALPSTAAAPTEWVAEAPAPEVPEPAAPASELDLGDSAAAVLTPSVPSEVTGAAAVSVPPPPLPKAPPTSAAAPTPVDPDAVTRPLWTTIFATLLPIGLLIAVVSVVLGLRGLSQRLRGRLPVVEGQLARMLGLLLQRAGSKRKVGLSVAPAIAVPMATGIVRPEIVVPSRVAEEMSQAHAETLLAHELAHVLRHDPAWRVIGLVIERVFFFQPLNIVALRGLIHAAEYLCDDWAARHTQRPLDLARCLTEVAGWGHGTPAMAAAAVDGQVPRSVLGRRVQRLLESKAASGVARRVGLAAAGLALVGLVALAPAVAVGDACDPPPRHAAVHAYRFDDGKSVRVAATRRADGTTEVVLDGDLDEEEVRELIRELGIEGDVDEDAASEDDGDDDRARRKAKRKHKRKAAKARRKAKKEVLEAFRDARKRGSPVPSDAEIAEILRRGQAKAEPPRGESSGYRLRILVPKHGEPKVMIEAHGEELDGLEERIEREVEQALREAERDGRRAILEGQRAREHAHREQGRAHRELQRMKDEARRGYDEARREAQRAHREAQRAHHEAIVIKQRAKQEEQRRKHEHKRAQKDQARREWEQRLEEEAQRSQRWMEQLTPEQREMIRRFTEEHERGGPVPISAPPPKPPGPPQHVRAPRPPKPPRGVRPVQPPTPPAPPSAALIHI